MNHNKDDDDNDRLIEHNNLVYHSSKTDSRWSRLENICLGHDDRQDSGTCINTYNEGTISKGSTRSSFLF